MIFSYATLSKEGQLLCDVTLLPGRVYLCEISRVLRCVLVSFSRVAFGEKIVENLFLLMHTTQKLKENQLIAYHNKPPVKFAS